MKLGKFLENAQILKKEFNIIPLLYGSLGLEVLMKEKLNVDDIDILIPNKYLTDKWEEFKFCLGKHGYTLIDLHEHTFIKDGVKYSYADIDSLERFAGVKVENIRDNGVYQLLSLNDYLKVYQASLKDNYRIEKKNKKDQEKIDLILNKLNNKRYIR